MKRLHNKKVLLPPRVLTGTLQAVQQGGSQYWIYTDNDLSHYNDLYAVRIEMIELPMLDAYEIKAVSTKGITVGYLFDSFARCKVSAFNYLCAYSPAFATLKLKDLRETNSTLQLKYKIKDIFLYSLGAYGSVITIGHNQTIKEKLEF